MSRYRTIHCKIWIDDKFPFLSDDAQLAWFHAFTCPYSNGIGIFHATIEALAASKRWKAERYRKALGEPLAKVMIRFDEGHQVVFFPAFFRHNRPSNPNQLKGLLRLYDEIPNCELKLESIRSLVKCSESWDKAFAKVVETFTQSFAIQEQEQEQEQDILRVSENEPVLTPIPDPIPYAEIIEFLNEKTGKRFKTTNEPTRAKIRARWNQGHRLEDFKTVILVKTEEWRGTEHEKYLRPDTLFKESKFEGYLNQKPRFKPKIVPHKEEPWLPDVSGCYPDEKF